MTLVRKRNCHLVPNFWQCISSLCRFQVILQGSSFSRSGKRRPSSYFWVIENRVVSYTPLCLKVVIEPFPSDFKGGLRFLGLRSSVFVF